ncbi:MAG: helix-hairpin-helix domain-containing protein [Acidimicrobiia bacterium]
MWNEGRRVVTVVVGLGVVVGAVLGWSAREPLPVVAQERTITSLAGPRVRVHVAGWVLSPGVVEVLEGSIVADVVEAAGGLRPGAVVEGINLAAPVRPGDQIVVPGPSDASVEGGEGRISLNRATAEELEALPGVGPVLAERIVAYRDQNGPFNEIEDLLDVPGIGEAILASLRDLVGLP